MCDSYPQNRQLHEWDVSNDTQFVAVAVPWEIIQQCLRVLYLTLYPQKTSFVDALPGFEVAYDEDAILRTLRAGVSGCVAIPVIVRHSQHHL